MLWVDFADDLHTVARVLSFEVGKVKCHSVCTAFYEHLHQQDVVLPSSGDSMVFSFTNQHGRGRRMWQYRCLFALGMDLEDELDVVEDIAGDNPKNYQVW